MSVLDIQITDMAGAYIEHSMIISNFLIRVGSQMQDNLCRIFGDNVQYKWDINGEEKTVMPDVSINCRFRNRRGNSFFNNPRFVMEVLSPSTEKYDRGDKPKYYLFCTVTEKNREDLRIVHFPNVKITFDELFNGIDYESENKE